MNSGGSEDWRPSAPLVHLELRARILQRIRAFFSERDVLEVDTPVLSVAGSPDPALISFATRYEGPGAAEGLTLFLHTSPEFAMKRLLAAGSGSIYQIAKVFRNGEAGRRHNPEFSMLEWYRVGFDHHRLMDEVEALVLSALDGLLVFGPTERFSYQEAFERFVGLNPHRATLADLAAAAHRHAIETPPGMAHEHEQAIWRDLLLTHVVEPKLGAGRLTFLYDYPATQAALARVIPGDPPLAARFELYLHGIELANGFHELRDAEEQRTRFERQLHARAAAGLEQVAVDRRFLSALSHGLPDCAGVALGIDRLVMLAANAHSLEEVIAFPLDRC